MKGKDIVSLGLTIFGLFLSGFGLYLAITIDSDTTLVKALNKVQIAFVILFLIVFILLLITFWRYLVHKRYSFAYEIINEGFAHAHKVLFEEKYQTDMSNAIEALEHFCSEIKKAFSKISGKKCSVCIKLFEKVDQNENVWITTLCRDLQAIESGRIHPNNDDPQKLAENTDFKDIFEQSTQDSDKEYKYFFSNNLPILHDYINSRIDRRNYPPKAVFPFKNISRYWKWPLRYKSTIVVPITPLSDKRLDENKIEGFLCLDSESMYAFREAIDVNIMLGIADGLYPTMKIFNESY